jgi:hypothetical protein
VIFLLAFGYTCWRYLLEGFVLVDNIPSYLFNKVFALASVGFFFALLLALLRKNQEYVILFGKGTLHMALLHSLLSVALLSPEYYTHLYDWKRMNWAGEMSVFTGVLSIYLVTWRYFSKSNPEHWIHGFGNIILATLLILHLGSMGYDGWVRPHLWDGNLPPISLVSFGLCLLTLALAILAMILKTQRNRAINK